MRSNLLYSIVILSFFSATDAQSHSCHQWNKSQWMEFREKFAERATVFRDPEPNEQDYLLAQDQVLKECANKIVELSLNECFKNMKRFVAAHHLNLSNEEWSHRLGFMVNDKDYVANQPESVMALPKEFERGLSKKWRAVAKKNKWPYVEFLSQVAQVRRVIFSADTDEYYRWILMSPVQPYVDILAVEKKSKKIYFREYNLLLGGTDAVEGAKQAVASCVSCHASGPREIVPAKDSMRAEPVLDSDSTEISPEELGTQRLVSFNKKFRELGMVDWHGSFHVEDFGPAAGLKWGCAQCHNGKTRSVLNLALSKETIKHKIVIDRSMPLHRGHLYSEGGREEIYHSILQTYKKQMKDWILQPSCH